MLTSTDNVLVIGTDQRPAGTHEAGANTSDTGSRSDTLMLWRVGGGVSRRLSIPRDTLVPIPGHGQNKINAAYAFGGPALTIKTVEQLTGIPINHVIIINFANFPKFVDAIGGVDVKTGRICSQISGGAANGGSTLNLAPGTHHLSGVQALTLARTRHNTCDPASNDLTREGYQQQILNAIKSQLLSVHTFLHLPWASWYAPQAVRTDMGAFTHAQPVRGRGARRVGAGADPQADGSGGPAGRRRRADRDAAGRAAGGRQAGQRLGRPGSGHVRRCPASGLAMTRGQESRFAADRERVISVPRRPSRLGTRSNKRPGGRQ